MAETGLLWTRPEWQAEARAWVEEALAQRGSRLEGALEPVLARSWSTILRAPASEGVLYMKASIPLLAGEAALCQALYGWRPDCILPVLAADARRGWMLMPDGGPMLRAQLNGEADLRHAEPLMPLMAGLQIDLIPHQAELLALAPFDRRLERLPGLFEALLDDRAAFLIDTEDGLTAEQYGRLRALAPRYREICARLGTYNIPYSLHHDDFHDGNVFTGIGAAHYRIADWAESCVAHPFFSMIICLRALADRAGFPDEATDVPEALHPALARLRDLYLAPWERFEPHARLVEAFNLAWRAGMINRALTWHAVTAAVEAPYRAQLASAVPGWCGEFLTLMERDAEMGEDLPR